MLGILLFGVLELPWMFEVVKHVIHGLNVAFAEDGDYRQHSYPVWLDEVMRTSVTFGGAQATSFAVDSYNQITATVPNRSKDRQDCRKYARRHCDQRRDFQGNDVKRGRESGETAEEPRLSLLSVTSSLPCYHS